MFMTACNERENSPQSVYDIRLTLLPSDAMRKRGLCCRPVSVRPSVTLVYSIHTAEDIVKLLSLSGSPITRSFFYPRRRYPIPKGNSSAVAQNTQGSEKFAIFDGNPRLSRKRYEIGPWLLLNAYKSYAFYRMLIFSMTLTDP